VGERELLAIFLPVSASAGGGFRRRLRQLDPFLIFSPTSLSCSRAASSGERNVLVVDWPATPMRP